MAKRKAAVNDIIYELDNEDIEISSEDEVKEAKMNRLDMKNNENTAENVENNDETNPQILVLNTPSEEIDEKPSSKNNINGGKIPPDDSFVNFAYDKSPGLKESEDEVDSTKKTNTEGNKTTIFNEDIIIDSPTSTSDLGVVGCENRTPLITVRFRDKKLASNYKSKVKAFMLRLIKLHEQENSLDIESETDLELDIWPEDLSNEEEFDISPVKTEQDNLFFIDTDPCSNRPGDIPAYKEASALISNQGAKEPPPQVFRRGPVCFNCDGAHQLRECQLPRNYARISEKRKNMPQRVGRYHVEDDQKYGHLTPGRISGRLRHALGLRRNELPLHIYRMRILGYPPAWLEEARISHSGITMFDSNGTAILDPEEEEGEVCEPGSKDKYDIKKILDFPGFNVPASSRYKEECHRVSCPPMSEQDSKIAMLQMLAPNAMKAYKRKKLTLFPSAVNVNVSQEVAEMELDSGDETAEFPSVPPLPDDAPPPPPPPPLSPPPPVTPPPPEPSNQSPPQTPSNASPDQQTTKDSTQSPQTTEMVLPDSKNVEDPQTQENDSSDEKSADDVEVLEVMKVVDIPVPDVESITIDDDEEKVESSSGRGSPSLDDLEEKKRRLLDALQSVITSPTQSGLKSDKIDSENNVQDKSTEEETQSAATDNIATIEKPNISIEESNEKELKIEIEMDEVKTEMKEQQTIELSTPTQVKSNRINSTDIVSTPEPKTGDVKTSQFGTPVLNVASPYLKLPSDDKFSKDICDVINFENLPNSTGKYKQISHILKRVKTEVDRIQDS